MNDVYEALSGVLEDLRCETEERDYSVRTEEMKSADAELKRRTPKYEEYLENIPASDKEFLVHYMEVVAYKNILLYITFRHKRDVFQIQPSILKQPFPMLQ